MRKTNRKPTPLETEVKRLREEVDQLKKSVLVLPVTQPVYYPMPYYVPPPYPYPYPVYYPPYPVYYPSFYPTPYCGALGICTTQNIGGQSGQSLIGGTLG
jgi:hypothetical protein